jgi:hypothetical protein
VAYISDIGQDKKVREYRSLFNTPLGRKVLSDMVLDLRVFDTIAPEDHDGLSKRNYGLFLLYNLGVLTDKNIPTIVDKMLDIEYTLDSGDAILP